MFDKKKKQDIINDIIDYEKIVDEMSDEAFSFCVSHLYPLCKYKVMREDEMRRVDLKEKLLGWRLKLPEVGKEDRSDISFIYLKALEAYMDSGVKYVQASRAERYRKKAKESIQRIILESGTLSDIDDVFLTFLSIFRIYQQEGDLEKIKESSTTRFPVDVKDQYILNKLYNSTKEVAESIFKKRGFFEKLPDPEKRRIKKRIYINNILFLCRAFDHFGVFSTEV